MASWHGVNICQCFRSPATYYMQSKDPAHLEATEARYQTVMELYGQVPGGMFGEMLPHPLYLATAFLGKVEPISVYTRKLSEYDWVAADELRVTLEGRNGLAVITESVNWSTVHPGVKNVAFMFARFNSSRIFGVQTGDGPSSKVSATLF